MSTSTEDEVGGEFDRMVRSALMGVMMTAESVSRAREGRVRDLSAAQEKTNALNERQRREQSRVVHDRVRRPEFWKSATVDQVNDVVAYTATLVPVDAIEMGTKDLVTERLHERFDLAHQPLAQLDPAVRRAQIAEAFDRTAEARFAQDNPDVARTLHDRLRRREYWEQAAPEQLSQVAELTARLAPHDARAAEADNVLREQLKGRYDIDLDMIRATHADPAARAGALSGELSKAVTARDVAANRDETRLVYDRVRRPEFWNQATDQQIADVVKYTRQIAPHDLTGREAARVVDEQLHKRFGIDLQDPSNPAPAAPDARRAALLAALDDQIAVTREGRDDELARTAGASSTRPVNSEHAPAGAEALGHVLREQESVERGLAARDIAEAGAGHDLEGQGAFGEPRGGAMDDGADLVDVDERLEHTAAAHEARADQVGAAAAATEATAGAPLDYQRVTDAELTQVPPVAAGARKQAATNFPRSTASGLRASAGRSKATKARVDRGADATRGQELAK
ncbi:hypothetical protein [Cellulomonas hominis]|uniref:hypothetical protein n=1 Tax=Cellulomonas hominis TaxID=156981 RepID=UPI001BA0EDF9|nr:hypothetical protein [Cellulomonas hominis]VTR76041.1 hypothetical protein CHMI_00797 [Cellulomonas hominis]